MTPDARTLAPEEIAELLAVFMEFDWQTLLTHVTDLALAYRDQGLVMGDLQHDGTIRAEVEA